MLGLPDGIRACLFDLDGVLTRTATVHAAAWKQMFDEFLASRDPAFKPFTESDYNAYVDGRPRYEGVAQFLASRRIELAPEEERELGDRKNDLVLRLIRERGVEAYPGSVRYLRAAVDAGLGTAVVSSSANCLDVIRAAGIEQFLQYRVDGVTAVRDGLKGKPAPDTFAEGARGLGVTPAEAAVFEDALAGVEAGRAGGFGYVVGVDRVDQAAELRARGASVVVGDLDELLKQG